MLSIAAILLLVVTACAPAAAPTATPTKAAAPAATTAAPAATVGAAATKPAATTPAAGAAATPAAKAPTGNPVKIGFINPLSGPTSAYGFLQRIAVNMAVEDVNATGGINGSPLQLVTDDSPFDPKQAVIVVRKQSEQDKVFAIVGPYSSGEMEVAAPLANQLQIVVASGSSTKVGVAENNRPWSFQMNVPDAIAQPPTIAGYKKLYPNVKNVVIIGDTKNAVTQYMVVDQMPKLLPAAGYKIIDTLAFDTGLTDFSAIVTKAKGLNPDGIVVCALQAEGVGLAKELQRQGVKAPVMTDAHPMGGPIVELAGDAVNGWVMPSLFDWENPDPKVQAFVKRFMEKAQADPSVNPKPNHLVTEASYYDTVMIFADIMRKAGVKADTNLQTARKAVLDGMTSLKGYQGIGGPISMLPTGNAERVGPPPFVAENGKYRILR